MRIAYRRLSVLTVVLLASPMASPDARGATTLWSQLTFQIGGYYYQTPPLTTPDTTRLNKINNAGIDWIWAWDGSGATLAKAATINSRLDALRNPPTFTLQTLPLYVDPSTDAGRFTFNKDIPPNLVAIDNTLLNGGVNSASTAGWGIWDEPCEEVDFTNIGLIARHIDSTQTRLPYVNLFAMYAWDNALWGYDHDGTKNCYYKRFGPDAGHTKESGYRAYLDAYLSQFNGNVRPAPMLSFDHYRFQVPSKLWNDYFWNLRLARDKTLEYSRPNQRIPLWVITQIAPFTPYSSPSPYFSVTFPRWQIYGALAYGAKGVAYWLLSEADSPGEQAYWGPGIMTAAGDTVAVRYSQVRVMNRDLHKLGPTLMRLDPVAVFHKDSLDQVKIAEELFTSDAKVYNILSAFGAGSDSAMAGYLKDRINGDDYLMVVSKALVASQTFTLTLTNTADSLFRIDRATGNQVLLGTNTTTISLTSLAPGQGELFRIVDQTYEYIPNINDMAVAGDTTWYAHDKGVVMVVRSTGRRVHYRDGAVYTPVIDLAVTNAHVFIVQDNGTSGNVVRTNRDLSGPSLFYNGIPRVRAVTAQAAESSVVVVDRLTTTTSNVKVLNAAGSVLTTIPFNDAGAPSTPWIAYDVQYQEGLGSFVVAHGRYYSRYRSTSPWTLLHQAHYRTPVPTGVRLTALGTGTSQLLFAGRNEGTIGGVEKMDYKLVRPSPNGWWPAGGTEPSVKDVHAAGNHVMFCSTSPGGDFFVRLRALDLWALGYRNTTLPRAVGLTTDSIAFMANGPGVARSSQASLAGRFALSPVVSRFRSSGDSLNTSIPSVLALAVQPNPAFGQATIRLEMPRAGRVEVEVFDLMGRRLEQVLAGHMEAGRYAIEWKGQPPGLYFVRLRLGSETLNTKVVMR